MTEDNQLRSIILWSKKAPRREIDQCVARMIETGLVERVDLEEVGEEANRKLPPESSLLTGGS